VQKTDLVFLKHFAQVIAVLFGIMVVLIIGAYFIHSNLGWDEQSAVKTAQVDSRIAPVGAVYSGDTGRAAMLAAQEAAKAALAAKVAFEGALDGELIYNNVCMACHNTGAGGAPLMQKTVWAPRIAQGTEQMLKHAIEGFQGAAGIMPAKGGRPDLTDEQVRVTVEYMLGSLK
jgi:cytochrome c5